MIRRLTILIAVAAMTIPNASALFKITPLLSCVDVGPENLTVYFGYESFEPAVVEVVVGSENRFLPSPANRSQPTLYFPGLHERFFRVTVPRSSTIVWIFNGASVAADISSPQCTASGPSPVLPPATVLVPYAQQLSAAGGVGPRTWSGSGFPIGLSITPDGLIRGTPIGAGKFIVTVSVTDGSNKTSSTSYSLTIVDQITINDAASLRPPGFSPQFRTVTQVGGTNSAIASCDLTEFVVTGGGSCVVPNQNTIQGRVASSQATSNGWAVTCSGGTATAMAVCQAK